MSAREGVTLPAGLFRTAFVPYDDLIDAGAGRVRRRDGSEVRVPPTARPDLDRALSPPAPSGRVEADVAALAAYTAGAWSPVRAVAALLALAEAAGATDVHLESTGEVALVRLRIEGELRAAGSLPAADAERLVAAAKHLGGCLPYRRDIAQEGRIPRAGVAADVRVSFLPTALGERAALRLFGRLMTLAELGLEPATRDGLEAALARPHGLLLVAGPSGGGKTTTIYACLAHLASRRGGAHLSIEQPVEQRLRLAGIPVDQVEADPERGLPAEAILVAALRQDVDVLAVGEVRTPADAALALRAAHTGRLVIAGLHAGSVAEARQRLLDLGADPAVLSATPVGVLHQRLEPAGCGACGGGGCVACRHVGRTRRPVASFAELS